MSKYSDSQFSGDPNSSWQKTFGLIPYKSLVLDVGCSSGTFGEQLILQKKCVVDGIEIDTSDIKEAEKKLRTVYKINLELDVLSINEKYDVVFFGDVIEHLANPTRVLKKVKELLKKDGTVLFSIPNLTHMSVRLMLLSGNIVYGRTGLLDETHLHFYNQEEIHRVFNNAGYRITHFDFTKNNMPFSLVKSELNKMGLRPNKEFNNILKSNNATAYQFIGIAKPSKKTVKQSLPKLSPVNLVEDYINEVKKQYEQAIDALANDRRKTAEDRDRVLADRNNVRYELNELKSKWYFKYPQFLVGKLSILAKKNNK